MCAQPLRIAQPAGKESRARKDFNNLVKKPPLREMVERELAPLDWF